MVLADRIDKASRSHNHTFLARLFELAEVANQCMQLWRVQHVRHPHEDSGNGIDAHGDDLRLSNSSNNNHNNNNNHSKVKSWRDTHHLRLGRSSFAIRRICARRRVPSSNLPWRVLCLTALMTFSLAAAAVCSHPLEVCIVGLVVAPRNTYNIHHLGRIKASCSEWSAGWRCSRGRCTSKCTS